MVSRGLVVSLPDHLALTHNSFSIPTQSGVQQDFGDKDPTLYHSLAFALQYLTFTRLDISYAVQQ
ncbi:hypothetical protein Tco_1291587, partial [Tanacetum coccineum]